MIDILKFDRGEAAIYIGSNFSGAVFWTLGHESGEDNDTQCAWRIDCDLGSVKRDGTDCIS